MLLVRGYACFSLMVALSVSCDTDGPSGADKKTAEAEPARGGDKADPKRPAPPQAPPADARKTDSGLVTRVLEEGNGDRTPAGYDEVVVHYTGYNTKGKMFRDTKERGRPETLDVDGVIPGLSEGLQLMTVGERRRLWVPDKLGYAGRPGFPRGNMVFDVELLEIVEGHPPIAAPKHVASPPAGAMKTKSGLAYKLLDRSDSKQKPRAWDRVTIHYTGWTRDGKMFDSSRQRGEPATFDLAEVMPGWREGLQRMATGDRARLWIPQALAYQGRMGRPAGMLVFDIELVSIERRPEPPRPPGHVAAVPKNARRTGSGLAYRRLDEGEGKTRPRPTSRVKVHYSAWTTDGELFDSSLARGHPATFPVGAVIPGWSEGLQLMEEGDRALFWIPEKLAYKGRPGAPRGMLVFEVELLEIMR